jgi:hypothetical protein
MAATWSPSAILLSRDLCQRSIALRLVEFRRCHMEYSTIQVLKRPPGLEDLVDFLVDTVDDQRGRLSRRDDTIATAGCGRLIGLVFAASGVGLTR